MHISLRMLNDDISLRLLKVQYLMLKPALGCVNWFLQVVDMVDGEEKGRRPWRAQTTCLKMLSPALATRHRFQNCEQQPIVGKI